MALELKGVSKKNIINEISLTVEDGEFVEILSNNSIEASIALRIIMGLVKASTGKVLLFNHDKEFSITKAKAFIGYTNGLRFKGNKTVIQYLNQRASFYKADYSKEIDNYLKLFNLDASSKISSLDSYQKANLAIVNVLFFSPKIIILDNILDSMDSKSLTILNNILYEQKRLGTAVISSSRKSNLTQVDKIYTIEDHNFISRDDLLKTYFVSFNVQSLDTSELTGASHISLNKNLTSCIYKGDLNALYKKLISQGATNIVATRPFVDDLDE